MYYNGAHWMRIEGEVTTSDADGNIYGTVEIGGLEWMTSNLRVTQLNDGTPLTMGGSGVPTAADWSALILAAGGQGTAGGRLKEIGLTHWNSPNTGSSNSTGFTARGGGLHDDGVFVLLKDRALYWQSDQSTSLLAIYRFIQAADDAIFLEGFDKNSVGISVRCVR